jgi:hypothetical protein
MDSLLKCSMVAIALTLLSGCETPQPDQPTTTNVQQTATTEEGVSPEAVEATPGEQSVNVTSPEASSGENTSVQSPAGASAAKTVAPLTQ